MLNHNCSFHECFTFEKSAFLLSVSNFKGRQDNVLSMIHDSRTGSKGMFLQFVLFFVLLFVVHLHLLIILVVDKVTKKYPLTTFMISCFS